MLRFNFLKYRLAFLFLFISTINCGQINLYLNDNGLETLENISSHTEAQKLIQKKLSDYWTTGYISATIDSLQIDSFSVSVKLDSGPEYHHGLIRLDSAGLATLQNIGVNINSLEGEALNFDRINSIKEKILVHYENFGYPFASVQLSRVTVDSNSLSGHLSIQSGKKYLCDSIVIKGDTKTKHRFIHNYIGIRPGDLYAEKRINKISNRIRELQFISEAKKPEVFFTEDYARLNLFLTDKNASQFDGILGLLPDNQTGKILLTGQINLQLINANRGGERFHLNWRKMQARTQNLETSFQYPYLFNTAFGANLKLDLYKRDSLFIDVHSRAGIQYLFGGLDYLEAYVESKSSNVLTTASTTSALANYNSLSDYSSKLAGGELNFTRLDYLYNPRKGFSLTIDLAAGVKKIEAGDNNEFLENLTQYNADFTGKVFIPLLKNSTLLLGNRTSILHSDSLYSNESIRFGGLKTLRGFDEESLNATRLTVFNTEFRYLMEKNSYLYLFYNLAWYQNLSLPDKPSDTPYGMGAGISFETKAGIFSINYALGKQLKNPIQFRAAKVHFGIINRF